MNADKLGWSGVLAFAVLILASYTFNLGTATGSSDGWRTDFNHSFAEAFNDRTGGNDDGGNREVAQP